MDNGQDTPDWDELFLSAALDPEHWPEALRKLTDIGCVAAASEHGTGPAPAPAPVIPRGAALARDPVWLIEQEMPARVTDTGAAECPLTRAARASARRAARFQQRIERQGARLLCSALDAMNRAAFILGRQNVVLATTRAGLEIVERGGLSLRGGRLEAPHDQSALERGLAGLFTDEGARRLCLRVQTGPRQADMFIDGIRLAARRWSFDTNACAMLVIRQRTENHDDAIAFLRMNFALTPSEADVALALFAGEHRSAIADRREVTRETLRGQIKAIYAKTGVGGEAALMRLFATILP